MPLQRGDVIITPSWHWHDHGNESDSPIIWLDALNLPLFRFAPVNYAELYSESRYPSTYVMKLISFLPFNLVTLNGVGC